MYLEPMQSFSAFPAPSNAVMCSSNTKYAGRILYGRADVNSESGCGGIVKQVTPPAPTLSSALFSYDLTGTATWSYPSCKTGYTRKESGKAHPNAYTCFKSAASTPPPAATPPAPTCPLPIYVESIIKQAELSGKGYATQDVYNMKEQGASLPKVLINYSRYKSCSFYTELVMRATAEYNKTYTSRPRVAYRA